MLLSRADVARALGVPLKQLTWWIYALREDRRYDEFEIARRNGTARHIAAPIKPIKDLQRRLAEVLEASFTPRIHVHGFVPSRGPLSNARFHRHKQWILRVDLEDFFPTINFGRVQGLFRAHPFEYPPAVATLLAHLCCHRRVLPQGAPTSPVISNLICRGLDKQLARLAAAHHCHYTRYADDLCFSSSRRIFPQVLATVEDGVAHAGPALNEVIVEQGFRVNTAKTRLMPRTQRQRVTGLVVNVDVNVPRDYVRNLRSCLYIWDRYGQQAAAEAFSRANPRWNWPPGKADPAFDLVIRGRVQYVGSIRGFDDPVYLRLARALSKCDSGFSEPQPRVSAGPEGVVFLTEGPSDVTHLLAARAYFDRRRLFTDLPLMHDPSYQPRNDSALKAQLEGLALTLQEFPIVGVFDNDSKVSRDFVGADGWLNLGNGVVAIALAPPPWRSATGPVCIEMLLPQETLETYDEDGRRLFLDEEFSEQGIHQSKRYTTPNPQSRTLVRETVFDIESERSVGLGKVAFADATSSGRLPFGRVDYSGFAPTFERIRVAVTEAWRDIARRRQA